VDIAPKQTTNNPLMHSLISIMNQLDLRLYHTISSVDDALKTLLPKAELRYFILKNIRRELNGELHWKLNLPVLSRNADKMPAALYNKHVCSLPVLFVRGEKSTFITDDDVIDIHRRFSNVNVKTIQNAGHWVHADDPIAFYNVVSDFLGAPKTNINPSI
jgi:pimeloyl-ACP methyl ester carboxylesterase